ncbi:MAG: TonB-dependent receptor [Chloracidobacterium sp.]|nr:TonB-dependent receptor [Chloracidobacterium sp.]
MIIKIKSSVLVFAIFILVSTAYGQSDRGTITGAVTDQSGAVIPNVPVVAVNVATGVSFNTQTTETGNFSISSVPVGSYNLRVEKSGFRTFQQTGVTVQVAQTVRINVILEIGSATDTVEVREDASLLRTESVEQSTVLNGDKINQLPLNFANNGVRNPLTFLQLAPGASVGGWNDIRVNGSPAGTFRVIFEGQDSTSALNPRLFNESQPTIDAVEEFALQSTNFSAEFGQVGGGLVNFTARSGTNDFHGTVFDYINNEALNAAPTFAPIDADGNKSKTKIRQHDFGGTFGGPVLIPHLYDGRKKKTFFFFSNEVYYQKEDHFDGFGNLPNEAYRNGDFSNLLTGRVLGTDPLGRDIMEGTIYDPATERVVNGKIVRDPFPGNKIPVSRFDPVAVKVQNLLPAPDPRYAGLLNGNFEVRYKYRRIEQIYSWKVDHDLSENAKLSVYVGMQRTRKDNGQDGLPDPVSKRRDQPITSKTIRINYDHTLRQTLINHFGVGYQRYYNPDTSPISNYDSVAELGIPGAVITYFPRFTGLAAVGDLGPTNIGLYTMDKPTILDNLTWTRANHTLKFGGEFRIDTFNNYSGGGATGNYNFSSAQTGLPSTQGQNLQGGGVGYAYASFLLGMVNNASISNPTSLGYRRSSWAAFAQDSWKVTPKLTLELGLRYDYQNALHELHDRISMFSPSVSNPAAGGLPGGTLFAGDGPGHCNCDITKSYPYGFGPRFGLAYRFDQKTVLRMGYGVTYAALSGFNYIGAGQALGFGFNSLSFGTTAFGESALQLKDGLVYNLADLYRENLDPGIRPSPGQFNSPPAMIDPNGGRPPRLNNWVINLQREVSQNLLVEIAYVGNRGAWYEADGLVDINAVTQERLKSFGFDVNSAADRALLTSRLDSPAAQADPRVKIPYAGYPLSATVAQSLRPYPQFGGIGLSQAPLGNTWYDSLQVKATKRFSKGLDFILAYTFSKNLSTVTEQGGSTVPVADVFNRRATKAISPSDQPHVFVASFRYEVPAFGLSKRNWFTRGALLGWNVSGILRYASGVPILAPSAQNNVGSLLFRGTFANRVPGQPLFLKDLNCGCIDPSKDFVLNPAAWVDPAPGQLGVSAPYYSDYRTSRIYDESMSFGKMTRFRERMSLEFRVEFFNIFNRVLLANPNSGNALATQVRLPDGTAQSGFGRIDNRNTASAPRSGQVALRFRF